MTQELIQTGPEFRIHQFSDVVSGVATHFQVMQMNGSVFIWAGTDGAFDKLLMGVPRDLSTGPPATILMGDVLDSTAAKLRKQVYVSINVPGAPANLAQLVERRIAEEISVHPELF